MSFGTITKSVNDRGLTDRINAAVVQEAWNNPDAGATEYGQAVRLSGGNAMVMWWPVCIASDVEEAYAYALNAGTPNPGADEGVVTDAMILGNVQAKWPHGAAPAT